MSEKKKVGILGGTFDPVHIAHLILAENAYQQFGLDTVLIMPSGEPPHKADNHISSADHRLRMVQLAIGDNKHFKLSSVETDRPGTTYTAETLTDLCGHNPDCEYYFIVGADSLSHIDKWYRPDLIMKHATLIAAIRDELDIPELEKIITHLTEKYEADIQLLYTPKLAISSHDIRERIARKESIKYMVPKDVEKYIYQNKLYL